MCDPKYQSLQQKDFIEAKDSSKERVKKGQKPFQRNPFDKQFSFDPKFVTLHMPDPVSRTTKKVVTKYQTQVASMIRVI